MCSLCPIMWVRLFQQFNELTVLPFCVFVSLLWQTHLSLVEPRLNLAASISRHKDDRVNPRIGALRFLWSLRLAALSLEVWRAPNFTLNSKGKDSIHEGEEKKKFGREVHCYPSQNPGWPAGLNQSRRKVCSAFLRNHQSWEVLSEKYIGFSG